MIAIMRRLLVVIPLVLVGCADAPRFDAVAAQLPPQGGSVRLFAYRDYDLSQSLAWVPVSANGHELGGVGPGHVLVCDLPPGTYKISVRSEQLWPGQERTVTARAGQQIYARIGSFRGIDPDINGAQVLTSTFTVMLQDSTAGRRDIAQLWYTPCQHPLTPGG